MSAVKRALRATPPAWIVVADRTRARLFTARAPTAPLTEEEDLVNPLGRLQERELVSDRPGRRATRGNGPTVPSGESAREHNAEAFAATVCGRLQAARVAGAVRRIHLVADREFLGLLRGRMDRLTRKLVATELGKSLTRRRAPEIRAALPARL